MQFDTFRSISRWSWLALVSALCCVSCSGGGGSLNQVKGMVFYKDKPLPGATVTFHPVGAADVKTVPSTGLTKEDGTFTLTTGQTEGVPAGDYVVTVICSVEIAPKVGPGGKKIMSTEPPDTADKLGGAYSNKANSSLKVHINPGAKEIEPFKLK